MGSRRRDILQPGTGARRELRKKTSWPRDPPQQAPYLRSNTGCRRVAMGSGMPVLKNKIVSAGAGGDWAVSRRSVLSDRGIPWPSVANGAARSYQPLVGTRSWRRRSMLLKNPDGTYMNPWSVNWFDLNGVHHTTPLDINCHCFNPATTVVLNPAAWQTIRTPPGRQIRLPTRSSAASAIRPKR